MEEKEAKRLSLELMGAVELSYLSTVGSDGFPQTRAMANLRNEAEYPHLVKLFKGYEEDFLVYFATGAGSDKMKHIKANPKGSVYFCDAKEMRTVLLAGSIEVVTDLELRKAIWQDRWTEHFPGGVDDPEYVAISLKPEFGKGWCKTEEFKFRV